MGSAAGESCELDPVLTPNSQLGLAMAAPALECLLACAGGELSLEGTIVPHDIDIGLQTYFD